MVNFIGDFWRWNRGDILNKWAKLSLAWVPFAFLTALNEATLEIGGSANPIWMIGQIGPFAGFIIAFGASNNRQRFMLALFNISYYVLFIAYAILDERSKYGSIY